jgi:hypothetical protein
MWKKLGLGAALLLVLSGSLMFIDKPVTGEPRSAASNRGSSRNSAVRRRETRRPRHRRHRRERRGNKNM